MQASSSRTEMLARYSALDARLPEGERNLYTEDVAVFLEVLYGEASEEGRLAYDKEIDQTDPDAYPWSAVRARAVFDSDGILEMLGAMLTYSPPALTLILARRADLEPEAPADELPQEEDSEILDALGNWDPAAVLDSITPFGWYDDPAADVDGTRDEYDAMINTLEAAVEEDLEQQPQVQPDPPPQTPMSPPPSPMPRPQPPGMTPSDGLSTGAKIGLGVGTFALVGLGVLWTLSAAAPSLPTTGADA